MLVARCTQEVEELRAAVAAARDDQARRELARHTAELRRHLRRHGLEGEAVAQRVIEAFEEMEVGAPQWVSTLQTFSADELQEFIDDLPSPKPEPEPQPQLAGVSLPGGASLLLPATAIPAVDAAHAPTSNASQSADDSPTTDHRATDTSTPVAATAERRACNSKFNSRTSGDGRADLSDGSGAHNGGDGRSPSGVAACHRPPSAWAAVPTDDMRLAVRALAEMGVAAAQHRHVSGAITAEDTPAALRPQLDEQALPYAHFRACSAVGWSPQYALVARGRLGEADNLCQLRSMGSARTQLTFFGGALSVLPQRVPVPILSE